MNGDAQTLIVGSTFSGVGGIDRGLELAGMRVAWNAEGQYENVSEESLTQKQRAGRSYGRWCRAVLAHHYPDARQYADVRDIARADDVRLAGGGKRPRKGADTRQSGSSEGARSHEATSGIDLLCGGFPCQDLSVAGKRAGLAGERSGLFHEFARIAGAIQPRWLLIENVPGLLSSNDGRDFGVVLETLALLGYGVAWRVLDSRYFGVPQRRRRVFIVGHLGGDRRSALSALCESCPGSPTASECSWQGATSGTRGRIARSLNAGSRYDGDTEDFVIANALDRMAGGPDDNSAQANHLVPMLAPTLKAAAGKGGNYGPEMPMTIANTLRSHPRPGSADPGAIAFHGTQDPISGDISPSMSKGNAQRCATIGAQTSEGVRRLTPRECERLQGFPDDWTLIPGLKCPDSRRYAAMGNAVTTNVAEWIGRRIIAIDAQTPETLLEAAALARGGDHS